MTKHHVFLGVPVGGDGSLSVATHRAIAETQGSQHEVLCCHHGSSALTMNFNALWTEALNRRRGGEPIDVFAMIHSDIAPEADWLDKLLEIFDRTRADILSAIVPIKNQMGLTSTALDTSRWTPRRLTMAEVFNLPPTFTDREIRAKFGAPLLLNTGLMLVRFTEPWAPEVCFSIDNCVAVAPGGDYVTFFEPEDWKFSRWGHAKNLNLVATREVKVAHLGGTGYSNDSPWGTHAVDSINLTNTALGESGMIPRK